MRSNYGGLSIFFVPYQAAIGPGNVRRRPGQHLTGCMSIPHTRCDDPTLLHFFRRSF